MAIVSWAAVLLLSTLSVVGCMGAFPGMSPFGYGGGYDLGYGGIGGGASQPYYSPQPYPYDPGYGGGYSQPYQPYYQSQPYAYYSNGGAYVYQPGQVMTPGPEATTATPPGSWAERRQPRQEGQLRQALNSGQLSPEEYQRLTREQAQRGGTAARPGADSNLSSQERARLNSMQNRSGRQINQLTNNGSQTGPNGQSQSNAQVRPYGQLQPNTPARTTASARPTMQPGSMAPARPLMQARPAAPPRPAAQARPAAQPRATSSRPPGNGAAAP